MGSSSTKSPSDVVIVSALRTPLCRSRKGALAKVPPSTLLTTVFKATLEKGRIQGKDIDDICLGNCLMPPSGFAAMRMAGIVSGIPDSVSMQCVNRQCSSGLQAVAHIANAISTKQIQIGVGGGVESMSFYPM
jgi:acetyl-CoA acyltransferase 1